MTVALVRFDPVPPPDDFPGMTKFGAEGQQESKFREGHMVTAGSTSGRVDSKNKIRLYWY